MQSALADEPRQAGDTAESNALVSLAVLPPQSVLVVQETVASACDTLTGPDTPAALVAAAPVVAVSVAPVVVGVMVASRLATWVSLFAPHWPPAPRAAQLEAPLLSRTPAMSPDA